MAATTSGFSRLVANAVLADQSYLKKLGGWIGEVHGQAQASSQLARLDARYKSLNRALHSLLYIPWEESDRILLTGYPGMALTGDGSETCKDGRAGLEVVPDFRLSEQKLREGAWIGDKLHRLMRESAYTYGWTFVETHRRAFIDRGICSGIFGDGKNQAEELRLPRKADGNWYPYNPADFKAYVPRKRWFRTPNDAFMTGNFHVAASLMLKVMKLETLQWFQLLLASTYSGAFHPTAEGHAAIADSVAEKARVVLQKYGQGPDPEPQMEDYTPPALPVDEPGAVLPDLQAPGLRAVVPGGAVPGGDALRRRRRVRLLRHSDTPNARRRHRSSRALPRRRIGRRPMPCHLQRMVLIPRAALPSAIPIPVSVERGGANSGQ